MIHFFSVTLPDFCKANEPLVCTIIGIVILAIGLLFVKIDGNRWNRYL